MNSGGLFDKHIGLYPGEIGLRVRGLGLGISIN